MQLIDKGQTYRKLNHSFIIFICLSDVLGHGRHIYTFENLCKESPVFLWEMKLQNFLNADSKMDDVSKELKAFLDYAAGKKISLKISFCQSRIISVGLKFFIL